jgi:hypothetical protein
MNSCNIFSVKNVCCCKRIKTLKHWKIWLIIAFIKRLRCSGDQQPSGYLICVPSLRYQVWALLKSLVVEKRLPAICNKIYRFLIYFWITRSDGGTAKQSVCVTARLGVFKELRGKGCRCPFWQDTNPRSSGQEVWCQW